MFRSIGGIIYLVVGLLVASANGYLGDVGNFGGLLNLLLAIILWPLVLLGVDFKLRFGGGGRKNNVLVPLGAQLAAIGHASRVLYDRCRRGLGSQAPRTSTPTK